LRFSETPVCSRSANNNRSRTTSDALAPLQSMAAAVSHRILRRGVAGVMRGAIYAVCTWSVRATSRQVAARRRFPGHDGPEGQSRLGDLTAPEGEVQREAGLSRCLALDVAEASVELRSDSRAGAASEALRRDDVPGRSRGYGISAARCRRSGTEWQGSRGRRADRSQRSPRDSSVTDRGFAHRGERAARGAGRTVAEAAIVAAVSSRTDQGRGGSTGAVLASR
jgi:hypothetical protein